MTKIFKIVQGNGPPVLLLHGFPETHLMWSDIAPLLAKHHTVVCADLAGYGRSACPPSDNTHFPYSKRSMAEMLAKVMLDLGFQTFAVVGHDRGARVAYRMALDLPQLVTRVVVLDIIPTAAAWDRADDRFALSFWPFSLLAQPEPMPENLILACPEAIIDAALSTWGTPSNTFSSAKRDAYLASFKGYQRVHAICEEYRAAASLDRDHDHDDRKRGRRISSPCLVLWSEAGGLNTWYKNEGGPLAIWKLWAEHVEGGPVPGGHFFPEEHPDDVAAQIHQFLSGKPSRM